MAKSDVKDPYEPIPQVDISIVSEVISASAVSLVSIDNEGVELETYRAVCSADRKSTRLNSSHSGESRMPSSA